MSFLESVRKEWYRRGTRKRLARSGVEGAELRRIPFF